VGAYEDCHLCTFPAIIILCLADLNRPAMDHLYFYVCHLDKCLQRSKSLLDTFKKSLRASSSSCKYYEIVKRKTNDQGHSDEEDSCCSGSDSDGTLVDYEDDSSLDEDLGTLTLGDYLIECWNK